MAKETVVTVAVMLPPSMVEYLDAKMAEEDLNRSKVVRKIIRADMEKNKKKKG